MKRGLEAELANGHNATMTQQKQKVTLLLPGFAEALGSLSKLPSTPNLQRWLSRADCHSLPAQTSLANWMEKLFGVNPDTALAPLALLDDGAEPEQKYWLFAEPVCLLPSHHHMTMVPADEALQSDDYAQQLVRALNDHFKPDGYIFEIGARNRWYLGLKETPQVEFTPAAQALQSELTACLPQGPDAARWHGLMNEAQMCLHNTKINQDRGLRGLPCVNGVWFWGGGILPTTPANHTEYKIYSDNASLRGLARLIQGQAAALPEQAHRLTDSASSRQLVIFDVNTIRQHTEFANWLNYFETNWASELLELLAAKQIDELEIWPGGSQSCQLDVKSQKRFWKRNKALRQFI
jgi:hypothetical protein